VLSGTQLHPNTRRDRCDADNVRNRFGRGVRSAVVLSVPLRLLIAWGIWALLQ
jgi:hypothetical protein